MAPTNRYRGLPYSLSPPEARVTSEAKVGIVALFVIAVVLVSLSKLGKLSRWRGEYTVVVCFDDLRGLPVGAPVRLRGVKIGVVSDIALQFHPQFPDKPACARLSIEKTHTLTGGDTFQVASGSLLGDKYLRVTPTTEDAQELDKSMVSVVEGAGPAGLEALAENAEKLGTKAESTVDSVNRLLADEQMRADLKATLAGMKVLAERSSQVAVKALALVDRLGPEDAKKVQGMVDNLYEVSRSLRRTAAGVNALVSTTTLPTDIDEITANLAKASEDVRRSTEAVQGIVTDPKTSEDIRTTLDNVREVSASSVELADKTGRVLDKVDSIATRVNTAIGDLPSVANPFKNMEVEGYSDVRVGSGPAGRIDVDLDLYPNRYDDAFWRVGVRDLGGDEKLDFQRGIPLSHRGERVRVGVIEGELGAGWDRDWTPRLSSEVDLIDPDRFRVDVRGRYRYNEDWDVLFGIDRALSGTEPFIGARRYFDF
ncbi:MAG: MCE family protein [Armatimonadetes bacterium]|nr:MCE family protein [Armatimonadota bacterium]